MGAARKWEAPERLDVRKRRQFVHSIHPSGGRGKLRVEKTSRDMEIINNHPERAGKVSSFREEGREDEERNSGVN